MVFRAMACLTVMAVVLLIGPEVYAEGSGVTELDKVFFCSEHWKYVKIVVR